MFLSSLQIHFSFLPYARRKNRTFSAVVSTFAKTWAAGAGEPSLTCWIWSLTTQLHFGTCVLPIDTFMYPLCIFLVLLASLYFSPFKCPHASVFILRISSVAVILYHVLGPPSFIHSPSNFVSSYLVAQKVVISMYITCLDHGAFLALTSLGSRPWGKVSESDQYGWFSHFLIITLNCKACVLINQNLLRLTSAASQPKWPFQLWQSLLL